jgi:CRP/FNR family cyclic AMP-dependent transcriptional regulator
VKLSKGTVVQRIATLEVGDTFGEMELLDVQPCIATVRTLEPTSVLTLSNMNLYRISKMNLKTYTMIILNLARAISRRLRRMDALVAGSLFAAEEGKRECSS